MNEAFKTMLDSANSGKLKPGKSALIKHLKGVRITQKNAIAAKCYDCNGMGEQDDCDITTCTLFPYSPYSNSRSARTCTPRL